MDIIVTYNVHHEMPFGILIAFYFYLTGLSAGSFVISVIATMFGRTDFKPLGKIGAVLAPGLLIL
ncbi:MAG: NrfD/PsrC family molybdoenzyme membrane anchor subunit, partial [Dehalococcoidia bacterium]|nr:NrfD/PsrC family molybdoenzyme membrane anchor subunit [Dehalococcoidia bacterium]